MMIRSILSKMLAAVLLTPAALALCSSLCVPAAAQTTVAPGTPGTTGSIFPVPIYPNGGGQYWGPADTVPPNLPPFDPFDPATCRPATQQVCSPGLLPTAQCGAACPSLRFVEHTGTQCVHCQGDPDGEEGQCFTANGWDLTFGSARDFCRAPDPSCLDANQNVTVCVTQENTCEIHLFESQWINHDLFPNRPVCAPVATQACLDGTPLFAHPHAFDNHHQGTASCGTHTVCLTFNKNCFCNAVQGWERLLGPSGSSAYDSHPLFHVGFTTCETCDCQDP